MNTPARTHRAPQRPGDRCSGSNAPARASGQPGRDRCPTCGRVTYIRDDGTAAAHAVPSRLKKG